MNAPDPPEGPRALERHVLVRTSWRVSGLLIEVHGSHAILRGRATTTHARQLAQQAAQDLLPNVLLDNAIAVDDTVEILVGMPLH
jgi:hypothetical protein